MLWDRWSGALKQFINIIHLNEVQGLAYLEMEQAQEACCQGWHQPLPASNGEASAQHGGTAMYNQC